ncbi:putative serine threonine protein kinase protein [Seiridium cardinale]
MGDIWDVAPGVLDQLHLSKMQTHTIQFWHVRNRATNFNSKDYGGIDQINIPRGTPPLGPGQKILPAVTMDSTPWPNRQGFRRARDGLDLDAVQNVFAVKEKKYRPKWVRLGTVKDFFEGPNFTYRKCLGFGGHGLALHYRFGDRDQPDQQFDFVVKVGVSKWPNKGLRIEETETRKLARAAHIVQVIDAADVGRAPPKRTKKQPRQDDSSDEDDDDSGDEDVDPPPKRPRKRRDELTPQELARKKINWDKKPSQRSGYQAEERGDQDFLLLEFVENGDLTALLVKCKEQDKTVPNRILWRFWLCMVKMCIAMAFPPRKFHPDRKNHQSELDEVVPDAKHHWRMKRMVHFDLDPWNIFVGSIEPDPSHHSLIPRLKLGDFGTAHEVKQQKREQVILAHGHEQLN